MMLPANYQTTEIFYPTKKRSTLKRRLYRANDDHPASQASYDPFYRDDGFTTNIIPKTIQLFMGYALLSCERRTHGMCLLLLRVYILHTTEPDIAT